MIIPPLFILIVFYYLAKGCILRYKKNKKDQKKIIKQKRFQKMQQFLNYKKYGFNSGGEPLINKD